MNNPIDFDNQRENILSRLIVVWDLIPSLQSEANVMSDAKVYRVRKRVRREEDASAFTTRNTSSGSTLVTISGNAYRAAILAAAKKLESARRTEYGRIKEPNI